MRYATLITVGATILVGGAAFAKLPPLSEEAKAKAADTTAKAAWADKVGAYKLCLSMDKVASGYRAGAAAAGKPASAAEATPPCGDPGPYVATQTQITPPAAKPLEASEAHSQPGMAVGAPSNKATSAEMTGPRK